MVIAGAALPAGFFTIKRIQLDSKQQAAFWSGMFFAVCALFYHVNPEYYLLAAPLFLLISDRVRDVALLTIATSLPWGVNFAYAVINAAQSPAGAGKQPFVDLYHVMIPLEPYTVWLSGILMTTALTLYIGVVSFRKVLSRRDSS
ncbi:hypothetical protein ACFL6I_13210 [candidate division KSB1 bacterium]